MVPTGVCPTWRHRLIALSDAGRCLPKDTALPQRAFCSIQRLPRLARAATIRQNVLCSAASRPRCFETACPASGHDSRWRNPECNHSKFARNCTGNDNGSAEIGTDSAPSSLPGEPASPNGGNDSEPPSLFGRLAHAVASCLRQMQKRSSLVLSIAILAAGLTMGARSAVRMRQSACAPAQASTALVSRSAQLGDYSCTNRVRKQQQQQQQQQQQMLTPMAAGARRLLPIRAGSFTMQARAAGPAWLHDGGICPCHSASVRAVVLAGDQFRCWLDKAAAYFRLFTSAMSCAALPSTLSAAFQGGVSRKCMREFRKNLRRQERGMLLDARRVGHVRPALSPAWVSAATAGLRPPAALPRPSPPRFAAVSTQVRASWSISVTSSGSCRASALVAST